MDPTPSALLDTTVVVDHLRGKSPEIGARIRETPTLYLPVTALGELLYGAYKSRNEAKNVRQVEDFLQLCAILGTSTRTAYYFGRIGADLESMGRMIPQNDIWIAAIAMEHNLALATRDPHFSFVPGLTVRNW